MSNIALSEQNKPVVKAKLRALSGPFKGKSFKLVSNHIYIGRAAEINDIVIDYDPYCSRKHALISKDPHSSHYTLSRIAQAANLYLGKNSVKDKLRLKNGNIITVGQTQFKFEILKKRNLLLCHLKKNNSTSSRLLLLLQNPTNNLIIPMGYYHCHYWSRIAAAHRLFRTDGKRKSTN